MLRSKADIDQRYAANAVNKIGAELRRLRTKRGERLEDVAEYLGIKSPFLYGIEQGDLSIIPSRDNVRAFTASYANYLGLDGQAITKQLLPMLSSLERARAPSGGSRFADFDRLSALILAASVALGVFTGWTFLSDMVRVNIAASTSAASDAQERAALESAAAESAAEDETEDYGLTDDEEAVEEAITEDAAADVADVADEPPTEIPLIEDPPTDLAGEAEQALAKLESETAKALSQPSDSPAAAGGPAVNTEVAALDTGRTTRSLKIGQRVERPVNVLATLVAKSSGGATIYEPENTDARVIVRALSTSWIQVSSRNRDYLWTRTMQPREMLLVPDRNDLELWAGDASGVEVLLDGVILPSLGAPGTVVRGVSLAPKALSTTINSQSNGKATF